MQELAIALRNLAKRPAFTASTVLLLVIGIALNATVFTLVEAILLRPLPFADADRLVTIQDARRAPDGHLVSAAEFQVLRQTLQSAGDVEAYRAGFRRQLGVEMSGLGERLKGIEVSPGTFGALGTRPLLGRALLEGDVDADPRPVVLAHGAWRRHFQERADVVGSRVRVGGKVHVVVGVMPKGFWFPFEETAFWTPLEAAQTGTRELSVVARLRPGVAPEALASEMAVRGKEMDRASGAEHPRWWRVAALEEVRLPSDAPFFYVLQGIMLCVLALACVNVSGLILVRTMVRRREMVIRAAVGATRWQLARAVLVETLVLVTAAAVAGTLASLAATHLLVRTLGDSALLDLVAGGGANLRVLGFAALATALTMAACGIGPVLELNRIDLGEAMKEGTQGAGTARKSLRFRRALVSFQLVLSMVLLTVSGLLFRDLLRQGSWTPGFDARGLFRMDLQAGRPEPLRVDELVQRARAVPGVASAAVVERLTPEGGMVTAEASGAEAQCRCQKVTADYLGTLGIRVVQGRPLAPADAAAGAVVVDEVLARRLWGNASPVGRSLKLGDTGSAAGWLTVVGVARAVEFSRPSADDRGTLPGMLYAMGPVGTGASPSLFVRAAPGAAVVQPVRQAVLAHDPDQPAHTLASMQDYLDVAVRPMRWFTGVVGVLSVLALVIAVLGLHGLVSYLVAQRTPEFGVRTALGARPRDVVVLVLRDAGRVLAVGIGVGCAAALAAERVISHTLLQGSGTGLTTMGGVALTLAAATSVACLLPALQTLKLSPTEALRSTS